jgi:cobalt/nickel transport system permease protein
LPDYAFKDSESAAGTSFSGIVGSLVVVGILIGAGYAFRFFRKKEEAGSATA